MICILFTENPWGFARTCSRGARHFDDHVWLWCGGWAWWCQPGTSEETCTWMQVNETPQPEPFFQVAIIKSCVDILDICILWGQQWCALLAIITQEIPRVIEARSNRGSRTRQSLAIRCLAKCCCYQNFAQRISWNASGCVWKWSTPRKKYIL